VNRYYNEVSPHQRPPASPATDDSGVTGVRLGELRAWLDHEARARGCSVSAVIRQAVQEHRKRLEDATT
jgi:hypothetical protein